MRPSRVVNASGGQRQSCISRDFDRSLIRPSGILGAADEAVLNNVHKKEKKPKKPPFKN
jgi:hypothetical protein